MIDKRKTFKFQVVALVVAASLPGAALADSGPVEPQPAAPDASPATTPDAGVAPSPQGPDASAKTTPVPHEAQGAAAKLDQQPADKKATDQPSGGTVAVVNIATAGWGQALRAGDLLGSMIGGWAGQPSIRAYLAGRPNPGALPIGHVGQRLDVLVRQIRGRRTPSEQHLFDLGKLLGVDYLVLLKVSASRVSARLFSVHRNRYAPRGFDVERGKLDALPTYVVDQTRAKPKKKKTSTVRWVLYGVAAVLAAVTLGLALSSRDDSQGDLRIRVSR